MNKTKYCKHCGEIIDYDCVVCVKCGKQVEELKYDKNIVINNSSSSANFLPEKKKKKYNLLLDLIMIFLTGGLWFIWILIRPKYEY